MSPALCRKTTAPCAGPCSSHSPREQYLWRLCPFRYATQAPVSGGKPTLLARVDGSRRVVPTAELGAPSG